ncbi:efflux RND transporter permease subunit [Thermosulfuriphilus sp.]
MRPLISWFVRNHVAANLLMVFILAAGLLTAISIVVETFPDVSLEEIEIDLEYRGASPSEIEDSLIKPIEERIAGLAGIKRLRSVAQEGRGTITVEVLRGWDANKLYDDIKVEVDSLTSLPEEAERPIVKKKLRRYPVITLAIYGKASEKTLKYWGERVKDELLALPGITEVELFGTRPAEIHVEIPEENLRKYSLNLDEIARIIAENSFDLPAGRIKEPSREVLLRIQGKRYRAEEYRNIVILARPDGRRLTLGEIATVKEGLRNVVDLFVFFEGQRAVIVQVFRIGNQNAIRIADTIRAYLGDLNRELPSGLKASVVVDMSRILKARLHLLLKNLSLGMILVLITLGLFLNPGLSFWIMLGIPISFAFGLSLLPHLGVSINMISLFAFILVLGIVVDDAIVIGESIHRHRERGLPAPQAAIEGTLRVTTPVVFSLLTTMAAFFPLLFGTGMMGKFIRVIPLVVIAVLAGSLVEALLVLPAHLSNPGHPLLNRPGPLAKRVEHFVRGPYQGLINLALKWRYLTVSLAVVIFLLVFSLFLGGRLKYTFFPRVEGDEVVCQLTLPPGTPVEETISLARKIEAAGRRAVEDLEKISGWHGPGSLLRYSLIYTGFHQQSHGPKAGLVQQGSHLAQITLELIPGEQRPGISSRELVRLWRQETGEVVGAESLVFQSELFGLGKPIEVALSHRNEEELLEAVEELKAHLETFPGVHDVEDSYIPGKEELRFRLKPGARELGITLLDLARAIRGAFYGAEALRFQRGEDEVQVLVRYPEAERRGLFYLKNLRLHLPDGREVPLSEVAQIIHTQSYVELNRLNRRRVIFVRAEVDEKLTNAKELRGHLTSDYLRQLKQRHLGLVYSLEGEGKEEAESTLEVIRGFLLALLLIYVLLAVPLKSYLQPLIIMVAIPFGIVGAFVGHIIMGYNISILSMFGVVGLSGVVVNDALVLLDRIRWYRQRGKEAFDAVIKASSDRFRPVILTTLTTFAGLMPMIFEKSLQARVLIPMAISLGFGVLMATAITLILVPCCYLILEDLLWLGPKGRRESPAS